MNMKVFPAALVGAILLTACGGEAEKASDQPRSPQLEVQQTPPAPPAPKVAPSEASDTNPYETSIILSDPDGITQLTWEDLMPLGEEEILAKLYEEYYDDLRKSMEAQSELLKDARVAQAGGEDFDLSLLIAEGSVNDTMEQIGTYNVVEDLDGLNIRLPGYVVPLDFSASGKFDEFLLVPYFGACLHTPPPPPNQIVYVKASPSAEIDSIYDPVWVEGTMKTGKFENDTGNSAYELTLSKIEVYEY